MLGLGLRDVQYRYRYLLLHTKPRGRNVLATTSLRTDTVDFGTVDGISAPAKHGPSPLFCGSSRLHLLFTTRYCRLTIHR